MDAFLTIKIVGAERAKPCKSKLGDRQAPSYSTEDWSHGSLLHGAASKAKLWEAEPGLPRTKRPCSAAQRKAETLAAERASWERILRFDGGGYDCDFEKTGLEHSPHQKDAQRFTAAKAAERKKDFAGLGWKSTVIRLRPRAQ